MLVVVSASACQILATFRVHPRLEEKRGRTNARAALSGFQPSDQGVEKNRWPL
jgi:hypothetical protein